jgi:peroxiredoxin Q/BCP
MLSVGSFAPDFSGVDQHGARTSLRTLLERGKLVLFFYPADFTNVCTAEACSFRDARSELAARGVNVAGVSPDSVESHQRFAAEHGLGYTLLADPERGIFRAYGALRRVIGLPKRITYVIAPDRRILGAFHHDLSAQRHLADVRQLLAREPAAGAAGNARQ